MNTITNILMEIAKKLNITTATLYSYVNGDGSLKERGEKIKTTYSQCYGWRFSYKHARA